MQLFGYEFNKVKEELSSFVAPVNDDGAVQVAEGGVYGTYVDLDGAIRTEAELVTKYRDMAQHPEVDMAIDDIVNEVITQEPETELVELVLDDLKQPESIKKKLNEEFNTVLELLEFNSKSYDVFRTWYIDGRLYYHVMIDENNPIQGIKELRYIDPRKIRKIRAVKNKRIGSGQQQVTIKDSAGEYFMYSDAGFVKTSGNGVITPSSSAVGIKISKDSIVHCTSGLRSVNGDLILGYLNKAIRPLNQVRMMEDSLIIYRVSRAPERRIFYVDVGNLPTAKAEQYLKSIMSKFKNKIVYDPTTSEIRGDKKFSTMTEDFWLSRRGDSRGTEITTLPGGAGLGQIEDLDYFLEKLYKSLNVPTSRLKGDSQFTFGRSGEITRDEVKFSKFVNRLRNKFSELFLEILRRQLILKNIIDPTEWDEFRQKIRFKFSQDNYFAELKESEILRDRVSLLRDMDDYAGSYWSHEWIRRHVLKQSDEEMKEIDKQVDEEAGDPRWEPPIDPNAAPPENPLDDSAPAEPAPGMAGAAAQLK